MKDRVSQAGIDSFVETTTSIVRTSVEMLKSGLMNRLDTAGIDFTAVPGLPELFQEDSLAMNPSFGLRNENEQTKYFKDHLNLVVSYVVDESCIKIILIQKTNNIEINYLKQHFSQYMPEEVKPIGDVQMLNKCLFLDILLFVQFK